MAYSIGMSLFRDATGRRQAMHLARLAQVNPFLPERVQAEADALGKDHVASAPVWSAGEDLDNPNVERAGLLATELSDRWRRRLERHDASAEELALYRDVATLGLYERTHPTLHDELIAGGLCVQPRWGLPEDIGKAVAGLARGDFPFSTGQVVMVDGGLTIPRL